MRDKCQAYMRAKAKKAVEHGQGRRERPEGRLCQGREDPAYREGSEGGLESCLRFLGGSALQSGSARELDYSLVGWLFLTGTPQRSRRV
jgi:hypothetical protein